MKKRRIGFFASLAILCAFLVNPANAAQYTWGTTPTGDVAGTISVSVFVTAQVNITAAELIAYEPANGVHQATSTVLSTAISYLGYFTPNFMYSVNYSWNTTGCHNGTTLQLRVQESGSWYSETRAVTVNNLSFGTASQDIIKWKDEASQTSETVSVDIYGTTSGSSISVNMYIYDCASATDGQTNKPVLVRTLTQNVSNPQKVYFTWDGKNTSGTAVKRGLYSFNISATRTMWGPCTDTINYRSETLSALRGVDSNGQPIYDVEFIGVDDNGTPTNQSDDKMLYVVRSYIAKDLFGATANSTSKIVLYGPDLNTKGEWNINTLKCRAHSMTLDGCTTTTGGKPHEVLVPVPPGSFADLGHYRYVVEMVDTNSSMQRWHQNRKAVQINGIFDLQAIEWLPMSGGWSGAWCKADFMDVIQKSWNVSSKSDQMGEIATSYNTPLPGKIRVSMNGGAFKNNGKDLKLTYVGLSVSMGVVKHGQVWHPSMLYPTSKLAIGTSVDGHPSMREGIVAFNSTGSDFEVKLLDHGYSDGGDHLDYPYNGFYTPDPNYFMPYAYDWKLIQTLLKQYHAKPSEGTSEEAFNELAAVFGPYEYGKIGDWILLKGSQLVGHATATIQGDSQSVLVIGTNRTELGSGKSGKDMFMLTCSGGVTIDNVRTFITTTLSGGLHEYLETNHKITNFTAESALLLDGGYSSQVYLSMQNHTLCTLSNPLGIYRYFNGPGVISAGGVACSVRPIPDYLYAEAEYREY